MFLEFGAGHGRADPVTTVFLGYGAGFRDPFDVHDELWLDHIGAELDQKIGTPREYPGFAFGSR